MNTKQITTITKILFTLGLFAFSLEVASAQGVARLSQDTRIQVAFPGDGDAIGGEEF